MADPFVQQLEALLKAQSASDAATRKANINRAIIDYGALPDFSASPFQSQFMSDIDPITGQLAAANTQSGVSQLARLNRAHETNQLRIPDTMAARGILFSGETGYQLGEENLRHTQAVYDTTRGLTDYISGALAAYQQSEQGRSLQLLEARQQASVRAQEAAWRQQEIAAMNAQPSGFDSGGFGGGGGDGRGPGVLIYTDPATGLGTYQFADGSTDVLGPGGWTGQAGSASPVASPSAWQLKVMSAGAQKAAKNRTDVQKQLFSQFADWRRDPANAGWWK